MPRIPGYQSGGVSMPQAPLSLASSKASSAMMLGQAVSDAAGDIGRTIQYVQQKKARVYSNSSMAKMRQHINDRMLQLQKEAGPGAEGYTPQVLKEFDDFSKVLLDDSPNDYATQDLSSALEELRANVAIDATQFEATSSEAYTRFQVSDSTLVTANTLVDKPEWFESAFYDQMSALEAVKGNLSPDSELKQQWETANTLALSAIQGEIRIDPKQAQAKLDSGYWDTYEWNGETHALITPDQKKSLLDAAKRAGGTKDKLAEFMMGEKVRNHLSSIENTGVGLPGVSADEVYRVFSNDGENPEDGEIARQRYMGDLRVSHRVFDITRGLKGASIAERGPLLEKYKPAGGSPTFADDQAVYEKLVAWNDADLRLLAQDPAQWADQDGDVSDTETQAGPAAGAAVSLLIQQEAGVPTPFRKPLTNTQSKSIVAQVTSMGPADALQYLTEVKSGYGETWGSVARQLMEDKLPVGYVHALSFADMDPSVGFWMLQALQGNPDELKKDFNQNRGMPWTQVENQVDIALQDFTRANTALSPERQQSIREIRDLVAITAATRYKSDSNRSIDKHINDVVSVLDENYLFRDTYYIPKVAPNGLPIDVTRRARELEVAASSPAWMERQKFKTSTTLPVEVMASNARWQTLSDGSGLRLVIERPQGVLPVYRFRPKGPVRGEEVIVTFNELARGKFNSIGPREWTQTDEEVMRTMGLINRP